MNPLIFQVAQYAVLNFPYFVFFDSQEQRAKVTDLFERSKDVYDVTQLDYSMVDSTSFKANGLKTAKVIHFIAETPMLMHKWLCCLKPGLVHHVGIRSATLSALIYLILAENCAFDVAFRFSDSFSFCCD
jgi:hypothetical protein